MSFSIMTRTNYSHLTNLLIMMVLMGNSTLFAQDQYPREFTNPDEIVAFDRSTSYNEAIEVLNQFYQEYENKFIIDQTRTSGEIGVSLPAMHWEDALSFILRLKNLTLIEEETFVEILTINSQVQEVEPAKDLNNSSNGQINLQTREVRINATFFEGNRRALKEIGVDWSTLRGNVPQDINQIVSGRGSNSENGLPNSTFTDQFVSVNSFNASSVSQNVFNALVNFGPFGQGDNQVSVQALFSAFEADNLGEVLATPFTKVVDGQEGRVQVGQDFSIKQRDIAGNVIDQFFSTGTILNVIPTVIEINDTSFIHLEIDVERSSAQPDVVSTIINKQEASTQALLLNGEATAIAGLYRSDETKVRRGIPILKDLPPWFFGLRYLFGFNSDDVVENELVIIVQASLEKTLEERANEQFLSRRNILDSERTLMSTGLDAVYLNELLPPIQPSMNEVLADAMDDELTYELSTEDEKVVVKESNSVDKTVSNEFDNITPIVSQISPIEKEEILIKEVIDESDLKPDTSVDSSKELVKELRLPVKSPELMVVVPRAVSLNEFLLNKENGDQDLKKSTKGSKLNHFVIGGAFIVKYNANKFYESLNSYGYESIVLFNPETRYNYVAYGGFSRLDEALFYLMEIRKNVNPDAWLFSMP